ncbi:type II toxin-antitoxin system PemK/MazF family toxin [Paenibacillus medicaginis]|uniref:mRNA interferase n=1 Tax=Paenibacillus medicaginis TaxID=1470560 RepID=A0ABV5BUS6_9BACL
MSVVMERGREAKESVYRGEIWLVDLNNGRKREQSGIRPCLVISNNLGNKYSPVVIVAPISSSTSKKAMPTHVKLEAGKNGVLRDSLIFCEQIKTVDKEFLIHKITSVDVDKMKEIETAVRISLGLSF